MGIVRRYGLELMFEPLSEFMLRFLELVDARTVINKDILTHNLETPRKAGFLYQPLA